MQDESQRDPISDGPLDEAPLGLTKPSTQHAVLLAELDSAGVQLGSYDRLIVGWLANLDYATVATIASLIRRAARTAD